jgi:hypothetical protein
MEEKRRKEKRKLGNVCVEYLLYVRHCPTAVYT